MIPIKIIESLEAINVDQKLTSIVPQYDFISKMCLCAEKDLSKICFSNMLLFTMQTGDSEDFTKLQDIIKPFAEGLDNLNSEASEVFAEYIYLNILSLGKEGTNYKKAVKEIRHIVETKTILEDIINSVASFIDQLKNESKSVRDEIIKYISFPNSEEGIQARKVYIKKLSEQALKYISKIDQAIYSFAGKPNIMDGITKYIYFNCCHHEILDYHNLISNNENFYQALKCFNVLEESFSIDSDRYHIILYFLVYTNYHKYSISPILNISVANIIKSLTNFITNNNVSRQYPPIVEKYQLKLNSLITALKNNDTTPILYFDKDLYRLVDSEVVAKILLLIEKNYTRVYLRQKKEMTVYKGLTNSNELEDCLIKHHITPLKDSIINEVYDALMQIDINVVNDFLSLLEDHKIEATKYMNLGLGMAIANTNKGIISKIRSLLTQQILSISFITNNWGVFISKNNNNSSLDSLYERIIENISLYSQYDPNFMKNSTYLPEMLLVEPSLTTNNIQLLQYYNKQLGNQYITNIQTLADPTIFDIIDCLLESNNSPAIINKAWLSNPKNSLKRITIANRIGMSLSKNDALQDSIISGINFPVRDDELDLCLYDAPHQDNITSLGINLPNIISSSVINSSYIAKLDQCFKNDNLKYNFNGHLISRLKVLRNMQVLVTKAETKDLPIEILLFNAITINAFLDSDTKIIISELLRTINFGDTEPKRKR